jgi:hypothetical protein
LAATWLADQSETNLSHILGLIKYGLAPALKNGNESTVARLAAYPNVSIPMLDPAASRPPDKLKNVRSLIEAGFIGKGERALNDESRVAPLNADTLAALHAKHPVGEHNPFQTPLEPSLPHPDLPDEPHILRAIASFSPDTAPGNSGWSVKLLRLASKGPLFLRFLHTLTSSIAAGNAQGRSLLCAARLTPLLKPDGGVRPIAVGELFYRLAMKAIFTANYRRDLLLPNQFGVGSKGGVEPIVQAVQRAAAGDPLFPYTHLYSLDSINAFNDLRRRSLAQAVADKAPHLLHLATWAHNFPAPLLVRSGHDTHTILSSEGVRQGDPMSTLWFSLAIRDTVDGLQSMLGSSYLVLAYLDDIFVLAPSASGYDDTLAFFHDAPVRLNANKCQLFDLRDTKTQPVHLLGSCVGSVDSRSAFLLDKVTSLETDLHNLRLLPHQHALLILRKSLQHKLRHLMRHLDSHDLPHLWARLDASLWNALDHLRGHIPSEADHKRDRTLLALPPALGGCGLFSHRDIAPLAYQAATAASTETLSKLVRQLPPADDVRSQRELSLEAFLIKQELLMASLDARERFAVTEAASQLGRRWLDVIPSLKRFTLTDMDIKANLHYRTLLPGYQGACKNCAVANLSAHDEACQGRQDYRVSRHDLVKKALGAGLELIPDMEVEIEPFMPNLRRKNDIRIFRPSDGDRDNVREEYDLKVMVLSAPTNQRSLAVQNNTPSEQSLLKQSFDRIQSLLAYNARRKILALPPADSNLPTPVPFFPLVMSSGGVMEKGMLEKLKWWRSMSRDLASYSWMISSVSIRLAQARGRTFTLS